MPSQYQQEMSMPLRVLAKVQGNLGSGSGPEHVSGAVNLMMLASVTGIYEMASNKASSHMPAHSALENVSYEGRPIKYSQIEVKRANKNVTSICWSNGTKLDPMLEGAVRTAIQEDQRSAQLEVERNDQAFHAAIKACVDQAKAEGTLSHGKLTLTEAELEQLQNSEYRAQSSRDLLLDRVNHAHQSLSQYTNAISSGAAPTVVPTPVALTQAQKDHQLAEIIAKYPTGHDRANALGHGLSAEDCAAAEAFINVRQSLTTTEARVKALVGNAEGSSILQQAAQARQRDAAAGRAARAVQSTSHAMSTLLPGDPVAQLIQQQIRDHAAPAVFMGAQQGSLEDTLINACDQAGIGPKKFMSAVLSMKEELDKPGAVPPAGVREFVNGPYYQVYKTLNPANDTHHAQHASSGQDSLQSSPLSSPTRSAPQTAAQPSLQQPKTVPEVHLEPPKNTSVDLKSGAQHAKRLALGKMRAPKEPADISAVHKTQNQQVAPPKRVPLGQMRNKK